MTPATDSLPTDLAAAHAMIVATRAALLAAEARASALESEAKHRALLIEQMKFTIAKLRHEQYGQSSERGAILEQLELRLADLEEDASQAEAQAQLAAAAASAAKIKVEGFERQRPARRPLPDHLPRAPRPSGTDHVLLLRQHRAAQDRRRRDRDAGACAVILEGDPARA
jgi:transposase